MRLIGYSKVSVQNKITLIEEVADKLNVKIGDKLAFLCNDSGEITIKNVKDLEINRRDK